MTISVELGVSLLIVLFIIAVLYIYYTMLKIMKALQVVNDRIDRINENIKAVLWEINVIQSSEVLSMPDKDD